MSALRRCGAKKKTTGTCQRVLDAFGVCPTHGQRPAEAADQPREDAKSATEHNAAQRVMASSGTSDPVSAVLRDRAVLLEVDGVRTADIASELGVAASTVRSWRRTPEYKTARRELLHELFAAGTNVSLQRRASRARVLDGIVHDTEEVTANRIRAAAVLDAMERHGFDMTVTREELDEVRDALGLDD